MKIQENKSTRHIAAAKKIAAALKSWNPEKLRKALSSPSGEAAAQDFEWSSFIREAANALNLSEDGGQDADSSEISQEALSSQKALRLSVGTCVEMILSRQINAWSLGVIDEEDLSIFIIYGYSNIALALIPHVDFLPALALPRERSQTVTAACWACTPCALMQDSDKVEVLAAILAHAPPEYVRCAGFGETLFDKGVNDSYAPLFMAARSGNPEILAAVLRFSRLEPGVLANESSRHGFSALILAARSGNCESLRLLLDAGHPLAHCDDQGMSALCHAAANANVEAGKLLLNAGALLVESDNGQTAFDRACSHLLNSSSQAKREALALLDCLAEQFGASLRSRAIDQALVSIFKNMSKAGGSFTAHCREIVDLVEPERIAMARDSCGESLLMRLANNAKKSGVEEFELIKDLFDINELSPFGRRALGLAIDNRNRPLAVAMLEHGASLPSPAEQTKLLFEICASGNSDSDFWLSSFCPDADFKAKIKGFGPLCTAASHGNEKIVAALMHKCRGERARDGSPALSCAAMGNRTEGGSGSVESIALLWNSEDAAHKSRSNSTILIQAAVCMPTWKFKHVLPLLMRAPLDYESLTIYGESARGIINKKHPSLLPFFDELALARREVEEIAKQTKLPQERKERSASRL